ncbi:MAG: hypothetical protein HN597_15330, partial [Desulfobacula sp.]|uniref:7-cyano-7-deazaguanine synthase n=1 Tax=Desulfobacula sp. TaxID=2593537 RepID=UPI0039B9AA56|nr:hypothetical protein [Desulfobacula sp.]
MIEKAIVLSSGGIDSTTAMAIAKSKGKEIYALSFKYGQRHWLEIDASKKVARSLGAKAHKIIDIDLKNIISKKSCIDKDKNCSIGYVPYSELELYDVNPNTKQK